MTISQKPEGIMTQGWRPIAEAPKELRAGKCEKFLITNNIKARNAHGFMSHVWLVSMIHDKGGEIVAFKDEGYGMVSGISHFMPLGVTDAANGSLPPPPSKTGEL